MIVKDIALTLLKVTHKEGVGKKSGKDYSFYVASVVDEDANVFGLNLSDELVSGADFVHIEEAKNVPVTATVKFLPKGFDIGGTLIAVKPVLEK